MSLNLNREAAKCRLQAQRFAGKQEERLLLRVAEAFEALNARETASRRASFGDRGAIGSD
jgi:hypothetical protein